jgi:hypothetical protein
VISIFKIREQIEDYLLHLGRRYLGEKRSMVLKLEVHDIEGTCKETITLPLEFKVSSGKVNFSKLLYNCSTLLVLIPRFYPLSSDKCVEF